MLDHSPPSRVIFLVALAVLLVMGWTGSFLLVAAGWVEPGNRVALGMVLGTMFGQATLAAVWTALGPGRFRWRGALCAAWMALLIGSWIAGLFVDTVVHLFRGSRADSDLYLIWISIFGQWLVGQIPLWILRWRYHLRIVSSADDGFELTRGPVQYGIRRLMVLTAVVAVCLGIGRMVVPWIMSIRPTGAFHEAPIVTFVVFVNLVLALPICLGLLLPRGAAKAAIVALLFVAFATALELSLLPHFAQGPPNPGVIAMFWLMNGIQAAWAFAAAVLLRYGGFALASGDLAEDCDA